MKIILLGANGQLGWELASSLAPLGQVINYGRKEADLENLDNLEKIVSESNADIIINAAAYTNVDLAEDEKEKADIINHQAPALLATVAKKKGAWLMHYSSDYVFDGKKESPYSEEDEGNPLNIYGESKLAGDRAILQSGCKHLIFRTSWVFSERGINFPRTIIKLALERENLEIVADQVGSPSSTEFLAPASALALQKAFTSGKDFSGLYNLSCSGYITWHGFACYLIKKAKCLAWPLMVKEENIKACLTNKFVRPALRPLNSRLSCEKFKRVFGLTPPPWQYYVDRLLSSWRQVF